MLKIGIMTYYGARNYGASLQAYALQEVLKVKYNASVINYKSRVINKDYFTKKTFVEWLKYLAKKILFQKYMLEVKKKDELFELFNTEFIVPTEIYTEETVSELNNVFDIVISGSDQIWNDRIFKDDWNYLLPFLNDEKKYSYAASFGGDQILSQNTDRFKLYLQSYKSLLIREQSGYSIIKELGIDREDVRVVADPVFLLSSNEWKNKLKLSCENECDYIAVLIIAKETYALQYAEKLAKKLNAKVKYINIFDYRKIDNPAFESVISAGPIEFLNIVLNAKCVITTSFHALAFALIFNVPFYYELNHNKQNNNDRIIQLSNIFDLNNYEIKNADATGLGEYDWKTINIKMKDYRNNSLDILFDSLREE